MVRFIAAALSFRPSAATIQKEPSQCSQRGSPSVLGVDGGGRRSAVPSGLFPNLPCDPRPRTVARPSPAGDVSCLEMFHVWKCFMIDRKWLYTQYFPTMPEILEYGDNKL